MSGAPQTTTPAPAKKPARRRPGASSPKRRCVSTACIACRKRKSKCDGAVPSCAACASVYGTECIYDPNSDHRRRGVYKDKVDSSKSQGSNLQVLIDALVKGTEEEAFSLLKRIRANENLDSLADKILKNELEDPEENDDVDDRGYSLEPSDDEVEAQPEIGGGGERELARKMGELRLENGSVRFIGGTSHLIYMGDSYNYLQDETHSDDYSPNDEPITTWTRVTNDPGLISHLMNKYFYYHYPYFTTLSKKMFERDYLKGKAGIDHKETIYCSSLLVNAMLALGCHFTDVPAAYAVPGDSRTKGDHFFAEAKRLIHEYDEYEKPRLVTVQALALMSVREAGCAREAKGWVYSGMSFRMAQDIGLNLEMSGIEKERMDEYEIDARRITFWGCFLFDKCWSNYLGRLPQLAKNSFNVARFEVFPGEDSDLWCPFPDGGFEHTLAQPSRTRAAALHLSKLCEISSDLLVFFYHPNHIGRSTGKNFELKKLSELHRRLEQWRKDLPKEFEPKERQLPNVILMHMFYNLQYIHLFRPFLKYSPSTSPLPAHVSPRRICTANAGAISKLMRLYKRSWNLRQICNIAVYMIHSACTIHLLNLPEKTAKRDITHGVKHLEEMAEDWLCARRTLSIISVLARKWNCELPEDAAFVLQRADEKYGYFNPSDVPSPMSHRTLSPSSPDRGPGAQKDAGSLDQQASGQMPPNAPLQPAPSSNQSLDSIKNGNITAQPPTTYPLNQSENYTSPEAAVMWAQQPQQQQRRPHPHPQQQQQQQQQQQPPPPPQPQPPTTSIASFSASFATAPTMSYSPGMTPIPINLRQAPVTGSNMENPDWFFNDGVRWQQSFESWNMPNRNSASFAPGTYVLGDEPNGARGMMPPPGNENLTAFEAFGTSLNQDEWLPHLE